MTAQKLRLRKVYRTAGVRGEASLTISPRGNATLSAKAVELLEGERRPSGEPRTLPVYWVHDPDAGVIGIALAKGGAKGAHSLRCSNGTSGSTSARTFIREARIPVEDETLRWHVELVVDGTERAVIAKRHEFQPITTSSGVTS